MTDSRSWRTVPASWAGPLPTCSPLPSLTMQVCIANMFCIAIFNNAGLCVQHVLHCHHSSTMQVFIANMFSIAIFNYACFYWQHVLHCHLQQCRFVLPTCSPLPSSTMQVCISLLNYHEIAANPCSNFLK